MTEFWLWFGEFVHCIFGLMGAFALCMGSLYFIAALADIFGGNGMGAIKNYYMDEVYFLKEKGLTADEIAEKLNIDIEFVRAIVEEEE